MKDLRMMLQNESENAKSRYLRSKNRGCGHSGVGWAMSHDRGFESKLPHDSCDSNRQFMEINDIEIPLPMRSAF
jgi:hypothetical protein